MEESEIIVGLDIGTTKICAIVGRKTEFGKLDILGLGKAESLGVSRGIVNNIQKTIESIKIAVEQASAKSDVVIKQVYVGIAGQHIKCIRHKGTIVRANADEEIAQIDLDRLSNDMKRLVMQPGDEIIHVIPQEYTVDGESGIKDPVGHPGVRLEGTFNIITGQIKAAKNIKRCVEKADLRAMGLFLEPLASAEAVLTEEEKEAGVALVDIGGGTTDLAIFQDGIIRHTAVIPLGGNVITEDIKEGCSVMHKQAEALKVKFGSALADEAKENEIISIPGLRGREPKEISVKNLAFIIQARVEEIFELIHYEIKCSGYYKKLNAGIVVTGGGAQLKNLAQLVEYVTALDTRIGYPNEHLSKSAGDDVRSPMYATAIGLVLKGFDCPNETEIEDTDSKPKANVKTNEPKKGKWFNNIIEKSKKWLEDENIDDYKE